MAGALFMYWKTTPDPTYSRHIAGVGSLVSTGIAFVSGLESRDIDRRIDAIQARIDFLSSCVSGY